MDEIKIMQPLSNDLNDFVLYFGKDGMVGDSIELKSHVMWLEISVSHHGCGCFGENRL